MARHEADREDIMREATALVERIELRLLNREETVIIGFRKDGAVSLFFGQQKVYHFNSQNELRRAFLAGELVKAEQRQLIALRRERTATEVQLLRRPLDERDKQFELEILCSLLAELRSAIPTASVEVVAQHPSDGSVLARVTDWIAQLPGTISIATRPNVV